MLFVAIVVGLIAGCLLAAQPSINGQLGLNVGHPLQAALISFATGTILLLTMVLVRAWASETSPVTFTTSPGRLPWWIWFGGTIGVILVTSSLIIVPHVGSLVWFAAVMTGQTIAAIALDHFGLLGNTRMTATPLRLLGAALLVAGVLAIVQARRSEENPVPSHDTAGLSSTAERN